VSLFNLRQKPLNGTAIGLDGRTYGTKPDRKEPIGGGPGYKDYPRPTRTVATLDELLEALATCRDLPP
jgi:hypothetical protein